MICLAAAGSSSSSRSAMDRTRGIRSWSLTRSATRIASRPVCRVPRTSPGPRSARSLRAISTPLLIGYGLLWLRPWAWGLSLAYAGFGIVSEAMNQLAFGFHVVRSEFMATTLLFALYLIWRRSLFVDEPRSDHKPNPASQELF